MNRRTLLFALAVLFPFLAWAAPSPREIVEAVYRPGNDDAGWEEKLAQAMGRKRPFTKAFNAAMRAADAKSPKDEVGWLDFDPVSNSQDPSIHGLTVSVVSETPDKATVRAEFRYDPTPGSRVSQVFYNFARENGAWALDDVRGGVVGERDSNWSLRKMASAATALRRR